jgi:hypothetical protein
MWCYLCVANWQIGYDGAASARMQHVENLFQERAWGIGFDLTLETNLDFDFSETCIAHLPEIVRGSNLHIVIQTRKCLMFLDRG